MKKSELKRKLIEDSIPGQMYSLDDGLPNEAICIGKEKSVWVVYYSEKGIRRHLGRFKSEEEACDYFYKMITEAYERDYGSH